MKGQVEMIMTVVLTIVILIGIGIPVAITLISTQTTGSYTEILLLANNTPTPAGHYIYSVSGLNNITYNSVSNATTDPGTSYFTLLGEPPTASAITIDGGGTGNVMVNGHYIGTLNGSGTTQVFSIPYGDVSAGVNTVVFG